MHGSPASADAERLELAMQRRALHADEFSRPGDIPGEAADLRNQVVALEHFPRLTERPTHGVIAISAARHRRPHGADVLRQHVGGYDPFRTPAGTNHDASELVAKLSAVSGPDLP